MTTSNYDLNWFNCFGPSSEKVLLSLMLMSSVLMLVVLMLWYLWYNLLASTCPAKIAVWASTCWPSSQARVTSAKLLSFLKFLKLNFATHIGQIFHLKNMRSPSTTQPFISRESRNLAVRESGTLGVQESGSPGVRESGSPGVRESGSPQPWIVTLPKIGCGLYKCCHRRGLSVLQLSCVTTTAAWWTQVISFFFPEAQRTYQRHKSGLSWCTLSLYSSQKSKYN